MLLGHRNLHPADLPEAMTGRSVGSQSAGRSCRSPQAGQRAGRAGHPARPLARYDRPRPRLLAYDDLLGREHPVSGISDTAALAGDRDSARELRLPTIRADAARLAETAVRERQTHLSYLAELLTAEIDDRTATAGHRRIAEADSPVSSGWPTSPPTIPGLAATLATLTTGAWVDGRAPLVLLGGLRN